MDGFGKTYIGFEGALWSVMKKEDKDHIILCHHLKPKKKIKRHYHKHANEWVIVTHGKFEVEINGQKEKFDISYNGSATLIHFPKKQKHSFRAISRIEYYVIRDRKDKTIYC